MEFIYLSGKPGNRTPTLFLGRGLLLLLLLLGLLLLFLLLLGLPGLGLLVGADAEDADIARGFLEHPHRVVHADAEEGLRVARQDHVAHAHVGLGKKGREIQNCSVPVCANK